MIQFIVAVGDFIHKERPAPRRRSGGMIVNYYRLYVLSAPEGRFVGFEEIEAEDDIAAVRHAEAFVGERPLELWCGSRKVRGFAVKPA